MNERERREAALASLGGEVLSAREIAPRETLQMLSVRLEPSLIAALRQVADQRGKKVSDVVRDAITDLVRAESAGDGWLNTWVTIAAPAITQRIAFASPTHSAAPGAHFETHYRAAGV